VRLLSITGAIDLYSDETATPMGGRRRGLKSTAGSLSWHHTDSQTNQNAGGTILKYRGAFNGFAPLTQLQLF
jgi:hypothetical protein